LAPSAQIIPICLIGAGSDEIGKAMQLGGNVRVVPVFSVIQRDAIDGCGLWQLAQAEGPRLRYPAPRGWLSVARCIAR
jgi:hypothetical protein